MAFKKAEPNMPFIKALIFGNAGTGKTYTSLLLAEGLAKREGKRIAVIDTEPNAPSGMYAPRKDGKAPESGVVPIDFDLEAPTDIKEMKRVVEEFDPSTHNVLVLDTFTWFWRKLSDTESVKTSIGTTSFSQWAKIKREYRDTLIKLLNLPAHLFMTAREQVEYDAVNTTEMKAVGFKAMLEKETPYETTLLIHTFIDRESRTVGKRDNPMYNCAEIIRDRHLVYEPYHLLVPMTYKDLEPIVKTLTGVIKPMPTDTQSAIENRDMLDQKDKDQAEKVAQESEMKRVDMESAIHGCTDIKQLEKVGKDIAKVKGLTEDDKTKLRKTYEEVQKKLGGK